MEVSLEDYKNSNIEKGFTNKSFDESEIIGQVVSNFDKGLLEDEVFEKAIGEVNLIKGEAEVGTSFTAQNGTVVSKTDKGWELTKASEEGEEVDEEEVEKGFNFEKKDKDEEDEEVKKGDDEEGEEGKGEGEEDDVEKGDDAEDVAEGGESGEAGEVEDEEGEE